MLAIDLINLVFFTVFPVKFVSWLDKSLDSNQSLNREDAKFKSTSIVICYKYTLLASYINFIDVDVEIQFSESLCKYLYICQRLKG